LRLRPFDDESDRPPTHEGLDHGIAARTPRPSADEALELLISGNQRFLQGKMRTLAFRRETMAELAQAQRPYATILGCSDSRVAPD
jgi:carbonic anhydrase